jgi:hypothetical protein
VAVAVYSLCFLTSLGCAVLLFRSWLAKRTRLLLWCALCFIGLALNNAILFADLVLVPTINLALLRAATALVAVCVLLFGLIWDSE